VEDFSINPMTSSQIKLKLILNKVQLKIARLYLTFYNIIILLNIFIYYLLINPEDVKTVIKKLLFSKEKTSPISSSISEGKQRGFLDTFLEKINQLY
jgi:hypothetical protein